MVVNWIKGDVVLCRNAQEFSSRNWPLARSLKHTLELMVKSELSTSR